MRYFEGQRSLAGTGEWLQLDADTIEWSVRYEDSGFSITWRSRARYCVETDLFCGRTPSLIVQGREASFEEAVGFAKHLGQQSRWIRPEERCIYRRDPVKERYGEDPQERPGPDPIGRDRDTSDHAITGAAAPRDPEENDASKIESS